MAWRPLPALAFLALALARPHAQGLPSPGDAPALPEIMTGQGIFAPFPVRVRVGTRADGILVTWEASADPVGGYSVFRSSTPIDRGSFPRAVRLADLPPDAREFLDRSDAPGDRYYAVLGRTPGGGLYEVFIPFRNVSISPVSHVFPVPALAEPAQPSAPIREPPPIIRTEPAGDGIRILWEPLREGRNVVIYRSTAPIRTLTELLSASWVASAMGSSGGILDFPLPGIRYHYALVDAEDLRAGTPELVAGRNVTAESVYVPAGIYRAGLPAVPHASRSLPLPYLSLKARITRGSEPLPAGVVVPPPARLEPETEKALARLLRNSPPRNAAPPEVIILPGDLVPETTGGEEFALRTIVRDRIAERDWAAATDELARYLALHRSPEAVARARFYRGQALASSGRYREAFFELLLAQDRHHREASAWIDWLLERLASPE